MIGTKLGSYEITAKLGEGGMGEVYRATDTKLKRDVAIKVLPAAFTEDKERLARFEREAQLLAQLHHPNIASIFGLEESDGTKALVMELVEGPTLAERLESGTLPFKESLSVSLQIAQALEEAHEKGIVHRDLKPQNIKASIEGKVKVLDFGLAKAMEPTSADVARSPTLLQSPTLTAAHGTQLGVILGTAAYMAPEQAKGMPIDKRADIWAFGVVFYEMLTGRSLFASDTVTDTLAGVLKTEIDFSKLPAETPAAIRRLLRRCLQRKPQDRLRDIGDARLVIGECLAGGLDETPAAALEREFVRPGVSRRQIAIAAAAALLVGLIGYLAGSKRAADSDAPRGVERRFVIGVEGRSPRDGQAISPDGSAIAFTAAGGLWVRALAEVDARRIGGGDGASEPFWSPDGRDIGFARDGALWRLAASGGGANRICDLPPGHVDGGTWAEDGTVVFALATGGWSASLLQCAAAGGSARPLLEPEGVGLRFRRPQALGGGAGVLYTVDDHSERGTVRILNGGVSRALFDLPESIGGASLAGDGRLYFSRKRGIGFDLWSVAIDPDLEGTLGDPVLLAQNGELPSIAGDGSLVFSLVERSSRRLALVDRAGEVVPVSEPFAGSASDLIVQLSPDGRRATLIADSPRGQEQEIWIADLERGTLQRQPNAQYRTHFAAWSPDGRELAVPGEERAARIVSLAGGGAPRQLRGSGDAMFQPRFTPDGEWLVFYSIDAKSGRDIWRVGVGGESPAEPLIREPGQQANPDVSPDGRYLAYQSDESGRPEIYVSPYPGGGRKWQVSAAGGASPIWNRRGGELIWAADDAIWSAPVRTERGEFAAGSPRILLRGDALGTDLVSGQIYYNRMYDLSTDGSRFLIAQSVVPERSEIVYVENPGGGAGGKP